MLETQGEWLTVLNTKNIEGFIPTSFVAIIDDNNKVYGHYTYSAEAADQLGARVRRVAPRSQRSSRCSLAFVVFRIVSHCSFRSLRLRFVRVCNNFLTNDSTTDFQRDDEIIVAKVYDDGWAEGIIGSESACACVRVVARFSTCLRHLFAQTMATANDARVSFR